MHADDLHVFTDVPIIGLALVAIVAWDVRLSGDPVPHLETPDAASGRYDIAREFMPEYHGRLDPRLRVRRPWEYMKVGAAYGCGGHLDQYVVIPYLRDGQVGSVNGSGRRALLVYP